MQAMSQDSSASADFTVLGARVCARCKVEKLKTEFPRSSGRGHGGFLNRCKVCERERCRKNYSADKWRERDAGYRVVLHYGVDEKFGDTWKDLSAALSLWGNMSDWVGWDDVSFTGQGSCHSIDSDAPYDVVDELRGVVEEVTGYSVPKQAIGFDLKAR